MAIDWNAFTPGAALAGGALIGAAASLLLLFNGRIAGVSGVVGGVLQRPCDDIAWRLAFVAGLVAAPWLVRLFAPPAPLQIDAADAVLALAGLLVGIGARYGAGCTSGHGVCGLARRSWRSLVAVITFMAAGFATVFVARHLLGS